ncbi:MAG: ABC transporter ATP-binding protein [Deltaproteobacteria bacterium]|nr:ABC transporter ATP-binding protein [Deltaproteobacteria bacterium]MCX7952878.1 ABC transporter ATP-binding protein [Deltaproteobacteria bacterium]
MTQVILEFRNVVAGYGKFPVIKGISFKIFHNTVNLFIGPNGAGKSTVLKCIFGLAKITGGEIIFNGESICNKRTHELVRLGISYVPQGRVIFHTLTVKENILSGGFILNKQDRLKNFEKVVEIFPELKALLNKRASFLSGGQQQLVALARGLMVEPRMLILDEPTLGVSPAVQRRIFSYIQNCSGERSVLLVEHNVKKAAQFADKIYLLRNGEIALEGNAGILDSDILKEAYLG